MAQETLTELIAKISVDAAELKKGLSTAEKDVEHAGSNIKKQVEGIKKAVSGISTAWAGVGAVIVGSMGMAVKSAMDAVESENLFTVSLGENADAAREWSNQLGKSLGLNSFALRKNVGTLFTMISSMGVAKSSALDMSKGVVELANDMASFYNLPTEEAFAKLRAGLTGETEPLKRLGILVDEATIKTTALAHGIIQQGQELTQQQKVQARYLAIMEQTTAAQGDLARTIDSPTNKMRVLGSTIEEVKIVLGEHLLPAVGSVLNIFAGVVRAIGNWVAANPQLVKAIMAGTVAIGGLIAVLFAAKAAVLLLGSTTNLMFGGILLAVGLLVTGAVLLAQNWDKVSAFFAEAWSKMKIAALTAVKFILDALDRFVGFIPGLGDKIRDARKSIQQLIDKDKIAKDIKETQKNLEALTKTIKDEFSKQAAEIQSSYDQQRQAAQSARDAAIEAINKEYGIGEAAKDVSETRIEAAKRATEEAKESYKREQEAAKTRYDAEMAEVRNLYDAKLETLNLETDATVKALQDQIDAIDDQTKSEELAIMRAEEAKKLTELKAAYDSAQTAEDRAKAKAEWERFTAEIARKELLRSRDEEKTALRQQIAEARERADEKRKQIKAEEDAALASLKTKFDAEIANLTMLSERADSDLTATLARIENERLAKIKAENEKLTAEINRLDTAEKEEVQFYADQLKRANEQVDSINLIYDGLKKRYEIDIVTREITVKEGEGTRPPHRMHIPEFAQGGIVPGPIGLPQLAVVHGGEAVLPNDGLGMGITINIDSFTANSERDVDNLAEKIVRLIRARTGAK